MATPLSAARALEALRAEGLRVVQHGSWKNHNRGLRGTGWGPLNGVMIHHTVTSGVDGTVNLCYQGRSDLPGPLCHGVIDKDGTVHLVGWGRANHAGLGDDDVLQAVIREDGHLPAPNERNADGNSRFYGFECINLGDGHDPWPEAQLDAIARAAAALCRAHGWGANSVIGHKEWTSWKVDPRGFSMDDMRRRIAARLAGAPTAAPASTATAQEDDDMPDYVSLTRPEPFQLEPGHEDAVEFTREYADARGDHAKNGSQFIHGPAYYQGTAYLELTGVDPGAEIQVRLSEVDRDDHDYVGNGGRGEYLGTAGTTFIAFPFTDTTPRGEGVRLRLKHFSSKPVTVKHVTLKAFVWPR